MKKSLFPTSDLRPRLGRDVSVEQNKPRRPLRILLLEDNANDAELVNALLRSEGFSPAVSRVETRQSFSALLERGVFDLILSDYSMPGFNGKTALKLAREMCPDTPFIFVSGTLGEDAAIESLKEGATD